MPSIEDLNKKREAIDREKRKIAERAQERGTKEHERKLAEEGDSLDRELEQIKSAEKMHSEARKEGAVSAYDVTDDEVQRLMDAAQTKARGGTPVAPKAPTRPISGGPSSEEK